MEHAVGCIARLVRVMLGPTAIASRKLAWGRNLCILGVDMLVSRVSCRCRPSPEKCKRWAEIMEAALESGSLKPGAASKLAGKLVWACQCLFKKCGRAMLRPLYDQQKNKSGRIDPKLRRALAWWVKVLRSGVTEEKRWQSSEKGNRHNA